MAPDGLLRDLGVGSEEGGAEEVVIEACCVLRAGEEAKLGRRKSQIGLLSRKTGL